MASEEQLKQLVIQLMGLDRLHKQISEAAEQEARDLRLRLKIFTKQLTTVLEHLRVAYEKGYQKNDTDEIWMQIIKILREMAAR